MKTQQAKELLEKYLDENASPKEKHLLDAIIEEQLLSNSWDIAEGEKQALGVKLKERIDKQLFHKHQAASEAKRKVKFSWIRMWQVSAAAIIVLALAGLYLVKTRNELSEVRFANDVKPGGNLAILTLSDGRKINLGTSKNGEVANLDGIIVRKASNGLLVFSVQNTNQTEHANKQNTIETPLGGQYQINLPDGTQVWLNAGTTLSFPSQFSKLKRIVALNGEAYFEVAKDKMHPFIVNSGVQEVEVLGTHFNINSYSNEPVIKTTLLEGSIKVSNAVEKKIIVPGEQAILNSKHLDVKSINPASSVDWKNGEFRFKDEKLNSILRKLSRWYGVEFVLEGDVEHLPAFSGSVSRFDQISVVLKMLEETGNIKFYINGKVITVK